MSGRMTALSGLLRPPAAAAPQRGVRLSAPGCGARRFTSPRRRGERKAAPPHFFFPLALVARRRLGHRHRIGGREGLFQPLLQLALELVLGRAWPVCAAPCFAGLLGHGGLPLAIRRAAGVGAHRARPPRHGRYGPARSRLQRRGTPASRSQCGTCRRSTPRSPSPSERWPLPVITSTRRAPRAPAERRKCSSAACASLCVCPCRSSRASIASLPRATRARMRRPSGVNGGGGWLR